MTAEVKTPTQKPAYEEYLKPSVIWWPWWVAVEYLYRATLCRTAKENLMKHVKRGHFYAGKDAKGHRAPLSTSPVDRSSFQAWVGGHGVTK